MVEKILTLTQSELSQNDLFLRKRSESVQQFDAALNRIINDLVDTLDYHEIAVGLSAVQIGVLVRVLAVDIDKIKDATGEKQSQSGKLILVNPRILKASSRGRKEIEACMSLPLIAGAVERPQRIHIVFQTATGTERRLVVDGLLARVLLHEIDHLDGILYPDRMRPDDELMPMKFS